MRNFEITLEMFKPERRHLVSFVVEADDIFDCQAEVDGICHSMLYTDESYQELRYEIDDGGQGYYVHRRDLYDETEADKLMIKLLKGGC